MSAPTLTGKMLYEAQAKFEEEENNCEVEPWDDIGFYCQQAWDVTAHAATAAITPKHRPLDEVQAEIIAASELLSEETRALVLLAAEAQKANMALLDTQLVDVLALSVEEVYTKHEVTDPQAHIIMALAFGFQYGIEAGRAEPRETGVPTRILTLRH